MQGIRQATHAGSWYSNVPEELNSQLSSWLGQVKTSPDAAKAIIGPHAGYAYSGPTAAWSYAAINPNLYTRVFLFGPSHHFYLKGCALPHSSAYNTPLGQIPIDHATIQRLQETNLFRSLTKSQEEDEHSLELHLPYIRKVFENKPITLVPIMVGELKNEEYGRIFGEFLREPENLFIVSSDFCHWGRRFSFTPYDSSCGEIWQSIEKMDKEGMRHIENQDLNSFISYLNDTENTICGRNPIILLLSSINHSRVAFRTKFVKYDQSSKVRNPSDSSVSYAAGYSCC